LGPGIVSSKKDHVRLGIHGGITEPVEASRKGSNAATESPRRGIRHRVVPIKNGATCRLPDNVYIILRGSSVKASEYSLLIDGIGIKVDSVSGYTSHIVPAVGGGNITDDIGSSGRSEGSIELAGKVNVARAASSSRDVVAVNRDVINHSARTPGDTGRANGTPGIGRPVEDGSWSSCDVSGLGESTSDIDVLAKVSVNVFNGSVGSSTKGIILALFITSNVVGRNGGVTIVKGCEVTTNIPYSVVTVKFVRGSFIELLLTVNDLQSFSAHPENRIANRISVIEET